MPRLLPLPKPAMKPLARLAPPKPPSLAEVAKRAEEAFIRFNQGPCVDGKAHAFKTQPFPPYAREFCAKCGVDKDDLATYRDGLRIYHGVGDRLWSGAPAPTAAAARPEVTPRSRAGLGAPLALSAGLALLVIGTALIWPPLANSGAGMFILLLGFAISIVAGVIWAADLGSRSNPALRRHYGFSDAQPRAEAKQGAAAPAAKPRTTASLAFPLLSALSLGLFIAGIVLAWPPLARSGVGLFSLFAGLALGVLLCVVWAAGGRSKSRQGP